MQNIKNLPEILAILIVISIVYAYNEWRDYKTDSKITSGAITDIKKYTDGETNLLLYEKNGRWNRVRTEYSSDIIYEAIGHKKK